MISAVSNVSFKADSDVRDVNALISSPGKFSTASAAQAPIADSFEASNNQAKKKNNTAAIIGGIAAVLAATWIGLGIAVNKGSLAKIEGAEKFGDKCKNFLFTIGESADKAYKATLGKWFGKSEKAAE